MKSGSMHSAAWRRYLWRILVAAIGVQGRGAKDSKRGVGATWMHKLFFMMSHRIKTHSNLQVKIFAKLHQFKNFKKF